MSDSTAIGDTNVVVSNPSRKITLKTNNAFKVLNMPNTTKSRQKTVVFGSSNLPLTTTYESEKVSRDATATNQLSPIRKNSVHGFMSPQLDDYNAQSRFQSIDESDRNFRRDKFRTDLKKVAPRATSQLLNQQSSRVSGVTAGETTAEHSAAVLNNYLSGNFAQQSHEVISGQSLSRNGRGTSFSVAAHSEAVLPQIGSDTSNLLNPITSKMVTKISDFKLSRQDHASFMNRGAISKDFIKTNKEELTNFIKRNRSSSRSELMRGYKTIEEKDPKSKLEMLMESGILSTQESVSITAQQMEQVDKHLMKKISKITIAGDVLVEKKFKGTTSQINSRVMEKWLHDTLIQAESKDIKGVLLKPESQNPLARYKIARPQLLAVGLSHEAINALYKSFFVYSVGFFETLKGVTEKTNDSFETIMALWKVYYVLLETCCQTQYELQISAQRAVLAKEMTALQQSFNEQIVKYIQADKIMRQNVHVMKETLEDLEEQVERQRTLRIKLEEEISNLTRSHEEEVTLRLKYEQKFNELSAAERQLNTKHNRLQEDFTFLKSQHSSQLAESLHQQLELISLKRNKLEIETQIQEKDEKIAFFQREKDQRDIFVMEMKRERKELVDERDIKLYAALEAHREKQDAEISLSQFLRKYQESRQDQQQLKEKFEQSEKLVQYQTEETAKWRQLYMDVDAKLAEVSAKSLTETPQIDRLVAKLASFERQKQVLEQENANLVGLLETSESSNAYLNVENQASQIEKDDLSTRITLVNQERHIWKKKYENEVQDHQSDLKLLHQAIDENKEMWGALSQKQEEVISLQANVKKVNEKLQYQATEFTMQMKSTDRLMDELKKKLDNYESTNQQAFTVIDQQRIAMDDVNAQLIVAHEGRRKAEEDTAKAETKFAEYLEKFDSETGAIHQRLREAEQVWAKSALLKEEAQLLTQRCNQFEATIRNLNKIRNVEYDYFQREIKKYAAKYEDQQTWSGMEVEDMRSAAHRAHLDNEKNRSLAEMAENVEQIYTENLKLSSKVESLKNKLDSTKVAFEKDLNDAKAKTDNMMTFMREAFQKEQREAQAVSEMKEKNHNNEINNLEIRLAQKGAEAAKIQAAQADTIIQFKDQLRATERKLASIRGNYEDVKEDLAQYKNAYLQARKHTRKMGGDSSESLNFDLETVSIGCQKSEIDCKQFEESATQTEVVVFQETPEKQDYGSENGDQLGDLPLTEQNIKDLDGLLDKMDIVKEQEQFITVEYNALIKELKGSNVDIPDKYRKFGRFPADRLSYATGNTFNWVEAKKVEKEILSKRNSSIRSLDYLPISSAESGTRKFDPKSNLDQSDRKILAEETFIPNLQQDQTLVKERLRFQKSSTKAKATLQTQKYTFTELVENTESLQMGQKVFIEQARISALETGMDLEETEIFLEEIAQEKNFEFEPSVHVKEDPLVLSEIKRLERQPTLKQKTASDFHQTFHNTKSSQELAQTSIDPFRNPHKSVKQNEKDRFEAYCLWNKSNEIGLMQLVKERAMAGQYLDEITIGQMRNDFINRVPYEFAKYTDLSNLTEEQRRELNRIYQETRKSLRAEIAEKLKTASQFYEEQDSDNDVKKRELLSSSESEFRTPRDKTLISPSDKTALREHYRLLGLQNGKRQEVMARMLTELDSDLEEIGGKYLEKLNVLLKERLKEQEAQLKEERLAKKKLLDDKKRDEALKKNKFDLLKQAKVVPYSLYHQNLLQKGLQEAAEAFLNKKGIREKLLAEKIALLAIQKKEALDRKKSFDFKSLKTQEKQAKVYELANQDDPMESFRTLEGMAQTEMDELSAINSVRPEDESENEHNIENLDQRSLQQNTKLGLLLDHVNVEIDEDGNIVITTGRDEDESIGEEDYAQLIPVLKAPLEQPTKNAEIEALKVKQRKLQAELDQIDLSRLTHGGVAAVNNAALVQKKKAEELERKIQAIQKKRADLAQLSPRKHDLSKPEPRKITGKSSLRSMIRAADSRNN